MRPEANTKEEKSLMLAFREASGFFLRMFFHLNSLKKIGKIFPLIKN
jgi:hypothetical protein